MARARGSVQKPPGGPYAQQCRLGYCARSFSASSAQQAPRLCPVSTSRQPCRRCTCQKSELRILESAQQAPRLCPVSTSRQPCRRCASTCSSGLGAEVSVARNRRPGCAQASEQTLPGLQKQMRFPVWEQMGSFRASCVPQTARSTLCQQQLPALPGRFHSSAPQARHYAAYFEQAYT